MKITVSSCAFRHETDIPVENVDSLRLDALANICISRAIDALKQPSSKYTEKDRFHITAMFTGMRMTHKAIRVLIEKLDPPEAIDALVLARVQLEALYAICLMLEDPRYVTIYLQGGWRKTYVQLLLQNEECRSLPRFAEFAQRSKQWLQMLADDCGITQEQQLTVDLEELGTPLPAGVSKRPIEQFPIPGKLIDKIAPGDKQKMLVRLYPEYQHLSSFAHGLPEASRLRGMFDKRSGYPEWLTFGRTNENFNKLVIGPAFSMSYLSIIQSAAELTTLYPADMDLLQGVVQAWDFPSKDSLVGKAVWGIRTRRLLGVIG